MKDDRVYLWHIRDCLNRIFEYTQEGEEAFFQDTKTQDAVIRNLEIIGEASRNLSGTFRSEYPDIPWRKIADMRNKLIHEYFGVNLTMIWDIVTEILPGFRQQILDILATLAKD
jgi:uncharacterized protein with HEPN domain